MKLMYRDITEYGFVYGDLVVKDNIYYIRAWFRLGTPYVKINKHFITFYKVFN